MEFTILYIFIAAVVIQLVYSIFFHARIFLYKQKSKTVDSGTKPVSIVICARNEEENLLKNIPLIMEQDYPDFEVIVVNDCSVDDTQDILHAYKNKYDNFKAVNIKESERFWGGKKFALTLGIKASENELLLLTDADCIPASKNWLKNMVSDLNDIDSSVVLGYGGYEAQSGFLNKIIRIDTLMVALNYFSFALAGFPYMGVGRNMAYKKHTFFKNKGFANHQHIKSGDDDLFINEVSNKSNTLVCISEESKTISEPNTVWAKWVFQKKRHLTTGTKYKFRNQLLLSLQNLSYLTMIVTFFVSIILVSNQQLLILILSLFALRYLINWSSLYSLSKRVNEKGVVFLFPAAELFFAVFYPYLFISNLLTKEPKWKI